MKNASLQQLFVHHQQYSSAFKNLIVLNRFGSVQKLNANNTRLTFNSEFLELDSINYPAKSMRPKTKVNSSGCLLNRNNTIMTFQTGTTRRAGMRTSNKCCTMTKYESLSRRLFVYISPKKWQDRKERKSVRHLITECYHFSLLMICRLLSLHHFTTFDMHFWYLSTRRPSRMLDCILSTTKKSDFSFKVLKVLH